MRPSRRRALGAGVAAVWGLGGHAVGSAGQGRETAGPTLEGPLADSATQGVYVFGVDGQGYIAQEYLLRGVADVYDPVDMADAEAVSGRDAVADLGRRTFGRTRRGAGGPYTTRLIVYRPRRPEAFSGNVIVELIHPSGGGTASVFGPMNAFFLGNGDAYCLVQHPVTFGPTRTLAPARYGALSALDPTQVWGMVRDAAVVLRRAEGALPGLAPRRRLYLTGYSYTGVAAATFANFHHDGARQMDGAPLFDGYLPMANATYVRPLDVPVMRMNTQSDFDSFGGLNNRSPDADTPGAQHRLYEVAGASHVRAPLALPGSARPPAFAAVPQTAAGQPHFSPETCYAGFPKGSHPNDAPFPLAAAAMFQNMYAWRDRGTPPPPGALITTDAGGVALTDAAGNARGGLRLPQLSVPAATYGVGAGACALFGFTLPFSDAKMRSLYGRREVYADRVTQAARTLVEARLLTEEGGALVTAAASARAPF